MQCRSCSKTGDCVVKDDMQDVTIIRDIRVALWLLVYLTENNILTLTITRTGTHSDLFIK